MSGTPFKALVGQFLKTPSGSELMQSTQGNALDPPSPSSGGTSQSTTTPHAMGGTQSMVLHPAPSSVMSQGDIIHLRPPIMGGIIQSAKDEFAVWTGGKPKADWSGLDPTGVTVMCVLTQIWPMYMSSSCKAYLHRVTGLVIKLALSGADFCLFCTKVNDHLKDTGMDSISYLPDPHDRTHMISVVTNYSRFTLEYIIMTWKDFKGLLDPYD